MENDYDRIRSVLQHLANERTFLAWIRSIICLVGVAFSLVTVGLKVNRQPKVQLAISEAGLVAIGLSIIFVVYAAGTYLKKTFDINSNIESRFYITGLKRILLVVATVIIISVFIISLLEL